MQGGAATSTKKVNRDSFSQFTQNLPFEKEMDFKLGNALFRKLWVSSPSYSAITPKYGAFKKDTNLSPRIVAPMTGLGLIEAIHPSYHGNHTNDYNRLINAQLETVD